MLVGTNALSCHPSHSSREPQVTSPWRKTTRVPSMAQTSAHVGVPCLLMKTGAAAAAAALTSSGLGQAGVHPPPPHPHPSNATVAPRRTSVRTSAASTSAAAFSSRPPSGVKNCPARLNVPGRTAKRPFVTALLVTPDVGLSGDGRLARFDMGPSCLLSTRVSVGDEDRERPGTVRSRYSRAHGSSSSPRQSKRWHLIPAHSSSGEAHCQRPIGDRPV